MFISNKQNQIILPPNNQILKLIQSLSGILIVLYAASLSLPITIPWVILTAGIIILVVHIALCRTVLLEQCKKIFDTPLTLPLSLFTLAIFISGLMNGGIAEAFLSVQGLRGMLVYFWAYWAFSFNPRLKLISISAVITSAALAGFVAAIEQLSGYHPFSFHYLQGTGFLSGPMAFSGLAQLFFFLCFGLLLKDSYKDLPKWFRNNFVFALILLGNFCGLLFCSERSAWFGAGCAIFISSLVVSRRATVLTGIGLVIISLSSWLFLPVVKERLSALANWQNDVSVNTRFVLWQKAWQIFREKPFFGTGIRHFPHLRITEALQQGHLALDHAHSNYLHILATTGIIGMLAYLYLWFSIIKLSYANQKALNSKLEQGIYLGIFAGIVSLAVSGLFEYNFGTGQVRLAQWFLIAMLVSQKQQTTISS